MFVATQTTTEENQILYDINKKNTQIIGQISDDFDLRLSESKILALKI